MKIQEELRIWMGKVEVGFFIMMPPSLVITYLNQSQTDLSIHERVEEILIDKVMQYEKILNANAQALYPQQTPSMPDNTQRRSSCRRCKPLCGTSFATDYCV
jgi:hypothetical protein